MHESGVKLLKLMFRDGETVCPHHTKYAYHSLPLENCFSGKVTLVPRDSNRDFEYVESNDLLLMALNPIKGFRSDENCTAYRNFLVEMDSGPLKEQLDYIKKIGMPYSACVFSGSKSLHFLISLDKDLPDEKMYRFFSEWILGVVTLADPNTKNPSRSIRLPGALREPGKLQRMVEHKGPVKVEDLAEWLKEHPDARPQPEKKREVQSGIPNLERLKPWTIEKITKGLDANMGRNKQWFAIACEFALAGYSEDDTMDILYTYFTPERDFKEREWKVAIKSGFKHIYDRK